MPIIIASNANTNNTSKSSIGGPPNIFNEIAELIMKNKPSPNKTLLNALFEKLTAILLLLHLLL